MAFAVQPRQTVVFTGDSITDCGRRADQYPLGDGYVRMASELIVARYPNHRVNVINTGIGGNTVLELNDRWTDDVICHKPDWVSVKIGINDLHRWVFDREAPVTPDIYLETYDRLLSRVRAETKARLILVDPFYISTDRGSGSTRSLVLKALPKYLRHVEKLARKHRARHVRTHSLFQQQLKHHLPDAFCPEPVHPHAAGHMVIAHGWLKAMGW